MSRAWLNLRQGVPERRDAFVKGLHRMGFHVEPGVTSRPGAGDILVTWNRVQEGRIAADQFEARGLPVLVVENATWGNTFAGERWYHIASGRHNTAHRFPIPPGGGPERWDELGVELAPFRTSGEETVILAQRGIGAPPTAMPPAWPQNAAIRHAPARIRHHPGMRPAKPLDQDLARARRVVTWGSGAAVLALIWGIPVVSEMRDWIGEQDNTEAGRIAMLRRLAWAQWRLDEIQRGEPFARLLNEVPA
jgi:hypothetical protein